MTRLALLGLALAFTSACVTNASPAGGSGNGNGSGNGSGSGSGNGSGSGGTGGGATVLPHTGTWQYGEVTQVSSTCSASTSHIEDGAFVIDTVSTSGFRIVPGDGTAPFTCTETGAKFTCPNRASLVMDMRPGLDAVITVHATATGTFSDTSHATGSQQATVDCVGTQCALAGPLPCMFAVNFEIHAN